MPSRYIMKCNACRGYFVPTKGLTDEFIVIMLENTRLASDAINSGTPRELFGLPLIENASEQCAVTEQVLCFRV